MGAILLLFGYDEKEQDWQTAKMLLAVDFLGKIKSFDVMTVTKKMTKELRKKYTKNEENRLHFNKDLAEKKSKAAAGLAYWITAIEAYSDFIHKM